MDTVIDRAMAVKYRRYLLPVFILPSALFVGFSWFPQPLQTLVLWPAFFLVFLNAGSPYFMKQVSYSYWILTVLVWMSGVVPAFLIVGLIRLVIYLSVAGGSVQ